MADQEEHDDYGESVDPDWNRPIDRFTLHWQDLPRTEFTAPEVLAVFGHYQARVYQNDESVDGHWQDVGQWIIGRNGSDPRNYPAAIIAQGPAPTQAHGQRAVETVLSSMVGAPGPANAARYLEAHPLFTAALAFKSHPDYDPAEHGDPLLDPAIGSEYLAAHPKFAARVAAHGQELAEQYGLTTATSVVVPAQHGPSFTLGVAENADRSLKVGDLVVLATATSHLYNVGRGEMVPVYNAAEAGVITGLDGAHVGVDFADRTHRLVAVGDLHFHYRDDVTLDLHAAAADRVWTAHEDGLSALIGEDRYHATVVHDPVDVVDRYKDGWDMGQTNLPENGREPEGAFLWLVGHGPADLSTGLAASIDQDLEAHPTPVIRWGREWTASDAVSAANQVLDDPALCIPPGTPTTEYASDRGRDAPGRGEDRDNPALTGPAAPAALSDDEVRANLAELGFDPRLYQLVRLDDEPGARPTTSAATGPDANNRSPMIVPPAGPIFPVTPGGAAAEPGGRRSGPYPEITGGMER
jgi:hypothetical protein